MQNLDAFFQTLYQNFNARNIEPVIAQMTADVKWANSMNGGFAYGHDGVREYWTRQFGLVISNVVPLEIRDKTDRVEIKVQQVVHDMSGNLLVDVLVTHVFRMEAGKIAEFNIEKQAA